MKKSAATAVKTLPVTGIGKRIREVRGALSQDDFCKHIGLPKRTLVRYEAEKTYPTADTLANICQTFDIDAAWLLFGKRPSNPLSIPPTARLLNH